MVFLSADEYGDLVNALVVGQIKNVCLCTQATVEHYGLLVVQSVYIVHCPTAIDQDVRPVVTILSATHFYCTAWKFNNVLCRLWAYSLVTQQLDPFGRFVQLVDLRCECAHLSPFAVLPLLRGHLRRRQV